MKSITAIKKMSKSCSLLSDVIRAYNTQLLKMELDLSKAEPGSKDAWNLVQEMRELNKKVQRLTDARVLVGH